MDCPWCSSTCGNRDKFCSQCGCKLQLQEKTSNNLNDSEKHEAVESTPSERTTCVEEFKEKPTDNNEQETDIDPTVVNEEGILNVGNTEDQEKEKAQLQHETSDTNNPGSVFERENKGKCSETPAPVSRAEKSSDNEDDTEGFQDSQKTLVSRDNDLEETVPEAKKEPSPPVNLNVEEVTSRSVTLCWERPEDMEGVLYQYSISYSCDGEQPKSEMLKSNRSTAMLSDLNPGVKYTFTIVTVLLSGSRSSGISTYMCTKPAPPMNLNVGEVKTTSVTLCWDRPDDMEEVCYHYNISYSCDGEQPKSETHESNISSVVLFDLKPGAEYNFTVSTVLHDGTKSNEISTHVFTIPLPPMNLRVEEVKRRSVTLCWERPEDMEGVLYQYSISYSCDGEQPKSEMLESNRSTAMFSDLKPGVKYTFTIVTVLLTGSRSSGSSVCVCTKTGLSQLLHCLGLGKYLEEKLRLSAVLEISAESIADVPTNSLQSLPWYFLRKLMMVNVAARSGIRNTEEDTSVQKMDTVTDSMYDVEGNRNDVHPLDVITVLFLCSDSFLQQEIALKMSMCQFSVPLLLPNCDTQQCTLMLWAMRDIVKKFRPHSLEDPKGFVEDSIILTKLTMVSFVRLGDSSLSKSHILNQVLSNPQQYHDTFIHHNMPCGDATRLISDGLVEISWYLPCGKRNIDTFSEPVAIANLRGDIKSFLTQFAFLCQASAAVFVFCDDFETNWEILDTQCNKGQLFVVCNAKHTGFNMNKFKDTVSRLQLPQKNIILKGQRMNDAEFVKQLRLAIGSFLKESSFKTSISEISTIACELGVMVDESCKPCQNGKQLAEGITTKISDIVDFKEKELPLQGNLWKELTKLEKEECRLKNAAEKNIEMYKSELSSKKQKLRENQRTLGISDTMSCFISAMSASTEERSFFLKWMRIILDNMSQKNLSVLREEYKERCHLAENKELISHLDKKMSNSSLGVEHFLREMGQLYESASSLPKDCPARKQMDLLPQLCARLLQDGFPLELVDGDASNIPLNWISAVLEALHKLTECKSRIRVITVLGVQSTGKSTLLNTMFGVQFAVSSGRCTRGAFMLLIKVKEDLREQLRCDYIMIIDTEGLKSPELAHLDETYEHDNELATLVVGLSDVTVINIAMENSTEMKDILQIVVHAFLRMKEVGRKPCCQFVHQNVPDVSAHDKNLRDRKLLLEQLNEMTEIAAKMEKKGHKKFTDIMEYNPEKNNWYIPGLWHGNPPMAPVNAGYSETVDEFKKSLLMSFMECQRPTHTFMEILEWTQSLWKAVKYENFIFSFRNSLVADAYSRLCTEFNKWEWAFRKHMYTWLTGAETKVSNSGTGACQSINKTEDLLSALKCEATELLNVQENTILNNVKEYYKRQESYVCLVEKYKEDFLNSAKTLRRETESSIICRIEAAFKIKKGMIRLDTIKKTYTDMLEKKVLKLIERCREVKSGISDQHLETEFGQMWDETVTELSFTGLEKRNVVRDIYNQLRANLGREGSSVHEILTSVSNLCECGKEPFKVQSTAKKMYKKIWNKAFGDEQRRETQQMADEIIEQSHEFIAEKVRTKANYHNTYIIDLLHLIDKSLGNHSNLETSNEFEVSLKLHICGHAAREFQQIHEEFIQMNDPRRCLEQFKDQYFADFKDLFYERDQCQKKAEEFANLCLAPAVREYVQKSLGPDIADEMLTGRNSMDFSTRSFFQFSVLKQLLCDGNFQNYIKYNQDYECFVKDWIFKQIVDQFSEDAGRLPNLIEAHQKEIIRKMKEAIVKAQNTPTGDGEKSEKIGQFIENICTNLDTDAVIPKDSLNKVMSLNSADPVQFSKWLLKIIRQMEKTLSSQLPSQSDVETMLKGLPFKPQDELFRRVFGCGKQCPFCSTPCEAGGKNHAEHFASVHRPQGIGRYKHYHTNILVTDICSSCVASEMEFRNSKTEGNFHPYKDYQKFYPDWRIQPDTSIEASDYWKYVLAKFNQQFAKEFAAKPANIPFNWKAITKEQALKSLEESFQMKKMVVAN